MKRIATALLVVLMLCMALALVASPSADSLLATLKRGFPGVNDYRADVSVTVRGPKISLNDMRMTLLFKKPNKVRIQAEQGMAMVPPGGFLGGNLMDGIGRGANATYSKTEEKLGRQCHVLRLTKPKVPNSPNVTLWIDKEHCVVVAMETSGSSPMKCSWRYATVGGKYYLPAEVNVDMPMTGGPAGTTTSHATVKFSNYRVNKGISDSVFKQKSGK